MTSWQPIAARRVSRHVELADGLDLYAYTASDGTTVIKLDTVPDGAAEHDDVGVPRLRIYVNDDIVHRHERGGSRSSPRTARRDSGDGQVR